MRKTSRVLFYVGLYVGFFYTARGQQQAIDLTSRKGETVLGLPGYSSQSGVNKATFVFEADVVLNDIDVSGLMLTAQATITNIGSIPLVVPVTLDQEKVHKDSCVGRIELDLTVRRKDAVGTETVVPLGLLYGSKCSQTSYRVLAPSEKMTLKISTVQPSIRNAIGQGDPVYLAIQLLRISDNEFVIAEKSNLLRTQALKVP